MPNKCDNSTNRYYDTSSLLPWLLHFKINANSFFVAKYRTWFCYTQLTGCKSKISWMGKMRKFLGIY